MAPRLAPRPSRLAGTVAALAAMGACVAPAGPVDVDPTEAADTPPSKADGVTLLPQIACADAPDAGPREALRHTSSKWVVEIGEAHHRGVDLVVAASAGEQRIAGMVSYGLIDKALEDEDVDLFACRRGIWQRIGGARTDDEGRFALVLEGDDRLPLGVRDLFLSVAGDRSGTRFVAVVAPETTELALSDVDGTLTTSESAFAANIFGIDASIHEGASLAWQHIAETGRVPVYVTARADRFTDDTRDWLAKKGMPRGALRLAPHILLPGSATVDYKTRTFEALATELPLALGVGNRASDVEAYANAGVAPDRIFIKLPEFIDELAERLDAGDAIGFETYPGPLGAL